MSDTTEATEKKFKFKHLPKLLKESGVSWNNDDPWRLSAVVAYYAILSLPGLLVIIINSVGYIWGDDIVSGRLHGEIASALGQDAANAIEEMVANTRGEKKSLISTIVGIATLVFGATGVFFHLQISLNKIWGLKNDPDAGIKKMLVDRAVGFTFILVIAFLLLMSFVVTAGIAVLSDFIERSMPDFMLYLAHGLNIVLSIGIITVLFALMFRYLPDAKVEWRTVWIGAFITSLLFVLGKTLLGLYFGIADPGSTYGAAGSVILVLLWVSYTCLILFYGAEFTRVYTDTYGKGVRPTSHAIHYEEKQVVLKKGSDEEVEEEKAEQR